MPANADIVLGAASLAEPWAAVGSEGIADLARRAADLNQTIRDLATHPNYRKTLLKLFGPEFATLLGELPD